MCVSEYTKRICYLVELFLWYQYFISCSMPNCSYPEIIKLGIACEAVPWVRIHIGKESKDSQLGNSLSDTLNNGPSGRPQGNCYPHGAACKWVAGHQ